MNKRKEKGNNENDTNNNSYNVLSTFYKQDSMYISYCLIPITVLGGQLALCKGCDQQRGSWDSDRFSFLPMFSQLGTGKAGLRPASRTHAIDHYTHRFLRSKTGPVLSPWRGLKDSATSHHFCLFHFSLIYPVGGDVLPVPRHLLTEPLFTDGPMMCVHHKCWFSVHFPISAETSESRGHNNYQSQCVPPLSKVRQNNRARHKPQFKNLLRILLWIRGCQNWKRLESYGRATLSHS